MRHKHADLIHAWAEGAEIEAKWHGDSKWQNVSNADFITWEPSVEYRIKPTPKPEVVYHGILRKGNGVIESITSGKENIRCVFDGETGELKSAKVLS